MLTTFKMFWRVYLPILLSPSLFICLTSCVSTRVTECLSVHCANEFQLYFQREISSPPLPSPDLSPLSAFSWPLTVACCCMRSTVSRLLLFVFWVRLCILELGPRSWLDSQEVFLVPLVIMSSCLTLVCLCTSGPGPYALI
jgi:hypothetical protein